MSDGRKLLRKSLPNILGTALPGSLGPLGAGSRPCPLGWPCGPPRVRDGSHHWDGAGSRPMSQQWWPQGGEGAAVMLTWFWTPSGAQAGSQEMN